MLILTDPLLILLIREMILMNQIMAIEIKTKLKLTVPRRPLPALPKPQQQNQNLLINK
jgi:hypothetical protein